MFLYSIDMNHPGKFTCCFIVFFCTLFQAAAQRLPDSTTNRIDQLFTMKNAERSPGFTIGIVRNDSLVYSKGYGLANLEYGVENAPETIYHMASVSKQFTAYCILLLEKQGRLKLT